MADEITPNIQTSQTEPISEPVEATIPSEPDIPVVENEPTLNFITESGATAQIPVNEPLDIPVDTEVKPVTETVPEEIKPVETEIQSESVSETIPESAPQITLEQTEEIKPEVTEIIPDQIQPSAESINIQVDKETKQTTEPVIENKPVEQVQETKPEPEIRQAQTVIIPDKRSKARELLIKARTAIQSRKRKKLDRVLSSFGKQTKITNDEVEKFLHVSDATATRYLSQLEKEGKIKQNGKTGKSVFYSKI